jgi:hypothetical protein
MKRTVPALRAKAHQLGIAALRTAPHLHSAEAVTHPMPLREGRHFAALGFPVCSDTTMLAVGKAVTYTWLGLYLSQYNSTSF